MYNIMNGMADEKKNQVTENCYRNFVGVSVSYAPRPLLPDPLQFPRKKRCINCFRMTD